MGRAETEINAIKEKLPNRGNSCGISWEINSDGNYEVEASLASDPSKQIKRTWEKHTIAKVIWARGGLSKLLAMSLESL
jgi:hypothetical protein